jgi:hypothetical protein
MYQVSLTAEDFTTHQRVIFTIWEKFEDGSRRQVLHDVQTVPRLHGGLFDHTREEAVKSMIGWLAATRPEFVDTDQ